MTVNELRDNVVQLALSYLGVKEGTGRHRFIIDSYNNVKPRPRDYMVKYTDSWCDVFVTFIFDALSLSNLTGRECGVEEHIKLFKKRGIWDENISKPVYKGDIVCYNWDDNTQPNNGYADHIGIVCDVDGERLSIVEGNYNNAVKIREINLKAGNVRGYAHPNYILEATEKYYYENLGWNKDENGWWYATGHNKGDFYKNCIVTIVGERFVFDKSGYVLKNPTLITDSRGAVIDFRGERL